MADEIFKKKLVGGTAFCCKIDAYKYVLILAQTLTCVCVCNYAKQQLKSRGANAGTEIETVKYISMATFEDPQLKDKLVHVRSDFYFTVVKTSCKCLV